MFKVVLTPRDLPREPVSLGISLTLIVGDVMDEVVLCKQLRAMIKPGVDIWIAPVRLVTEHHYVATKTATKIDK